MKVNKLFATVIAVAALAASAAVPQLVLSGKTGSSEPRSKEMLRLERMSQTKSEYSVGPRFEASGNADGINRIVYSCASTILSAPFNAVFSFDEANGKVTIENLGGFAANESYGFVPDVIEAPYAEGVITIPCSGLGPDEANSTRLGVLQAYGMDLYLRVGKIEYDDNFMSSIPVAEPELKLYVSDDYSTIETRLADGQSVAGVIDYTDMFDMWACSGACQGGMQFTRIAGGPLWELSDTEVDFGNVFTGVESYGYVTIKSKGDEAVDFKATIDSPAFSVTPAEGTVEVSGKSKLEISFCPEDPGDYDATLTIVAGGKEEKVHLTGVAEKRETDFSSIVKEGDASTITWENNSEAAWRLDGEMAVFKCGEDEATSVLKAVLTGNKAKRLTFDIDMSCSIDDGLIFKTEGRSMFEYKSKLNHTVSYIIPGGKRNVEFVAFNGYYAEGQVKIGNVRLEEVSSWEGLSPDASVSPLTSEGFININGKATASSSSSVMMLSLNPKEESNLSFDYEAGSSEITVEMNESPLATLAAGEKGTFHYDLAQGTPAFIMIKVKTPADEMEESASIGNVRFVKGKYNDTPKKYNAIVNSYLDGDDSYTENGEILNYSLDITLTSGGKAIFKNLLPENEYYPEAQVIEGTWEGNKIHIPTWKNANIGTIVGYDNESFDYFPYYWGNRFWLVAGKINNELKQTEVLNELTFTISEDGSIITPDSDFGVWYTWSFQDKSIISFYKADSKFVVATEGASIAASAENVDFGTVIANGYEYKRAISLVSLGSDCEYSAVVEGGNGHFSVDPDNGVIKTGENALLNVTFSSEEQGTLEAVLKIYSDGNDLEIPLMAVVEAVPDYSVIVKEGKELITFDSKSEYPWAIEDGVAVSTNEGVHNSMSTLGLVFTVPEGKVGLFGLKGATCAEPNYDGFAIVVDGRTLYSDVTRNESVDVQIPLPAGEYNMQLIHARDSKDELYSAYDRTEVSAVSLRIVDAGAHHFRLDPPYKMLAPAGEVVSDVVAVENLLEEPVTILEVKGEGCFGALMPEQTTLSGKNSAVNIPVTFQAEKAGDYTGVITVVTSVGNVEIPVSAKADYVKYIGNGESSSFAGPYVTALMLYGETECTATMLYPAEMMESLKGASIESLTFFPTRLPDYTFSCPDVLAEVGENDSFDIDTRVEGLLPVMTGEMVDADNWELTIPFDAPYQYRGGNFLFQLTNNEQERFGGNTPVQMAFRHFTSFPGKTVITLHEISDAPVKTLPYMRVKYDPSTVGVDNIQMSLSEITGVEYYTTDGIRIEAPVSGLNVVVTHYKDGQTRSSVMLKR